MLSFDSWVRWIFDRPPGWDWTYDGPWEDVGPPERIAEYLAQLFESAGQLLSSYSDAQVNEGLGYIASPGRSGHFCDLLDPDVPWPLQQRGIRAMVPLFRDCFGARCSQHLSHLDVRGANPVNGVCYMWWDIAPVYGEPQDPARREIDMEVLDVMKKTLAIPHIACQEGALHGLGHWQSAYPDFVHETIDEFLRQNRWSLLLRTDLKNYARAARQGRVN